MNEKLSKTYNRLSIASRGFALLFIVYYLSGNVEYSPVIPFVNYMSSIGIEWMPQLNVMPTTDNLIEYLAYHSLTASFYVAFFMIPVGVFSELSDRYKHGSWTELRAARNKEYEESLVSCGKLLDVQIDQGGFFSNAKILIKTEKAIFNCFGSIERVDLEQEIKRRGNVIYLSDNGKNKEFRLV